MCTANWSDRNGIISQTATVSAIVRVAILAARTPIAGRCAVRTVRCRPFVVRRPSIPHLCGAVSAALVGGLLAQLADGVVGAFGGLATAGCRRAETTAAAAATRLGQHLALVFLWTDFIQLDSLCSSFASLLLFPFLIIVGFTRLSARPFPAPFSHLNNREAPPPPPPPDLSQLSVPVPFPTS